MKILVLMPLQEQMVYAATGIDKYLNTDVRLNTFNMPMFMQYLISTKAAETWTHALYYSIVAAKSVYNAAVAKDEDLIVFGNMPSSFKFDAVFNFQDIEKALPYKDDFINKLLDICKDEDFLLQYINDLHKADESTMALENCHATAQFINDYIKTDPKLEEIKKEYEDRLDFKELTDGSENNKA